MVRGFWQSKLAMGAIAVLTVGLASAVWVRDQGRAIYIPVVASLLMLVIGLLTARLVGNIVATNQCTKALGILHMELDPETFLTNFRAVPGRIPEESRDHAIVSAYLADGYAAAGQFQEAIRVLGAPYVSPKKEDPALDGMYYGNLCRYALGAGDLDAAKEAAASLEHIATRRCGGKPQLAENLKTTYRLLENCRAGLEGKEADTQWLNRQLEQAPYKIRSLEILQILAMDARNRGDAKGANRYLTRMQQEGGKTWYHSWATEQAKRQKQ